jgi:putative hydroxymethylpyrimidine transport system substrate-binding protein
VRRNTIPLLSLVAVLLVAAASAGAGRRSTASLSLMLDWTPNPDHAAIFVADRQGLFAKHGLSVSVHAPSDPTTPLKLVGAGRVDLAVSYEPELFFAAEKHLPVVAVAALVPRALDSLISLKPLPSLRGHSIGITGVPSDDAALQSILERQHLTRKDVHVVHVGYNLVPALLAHRVDAIIGGYRNVEGIQLQQRGLHPSITPLDRAGVPSYDELVVAASAQRLKDDRAYAASVRSFVAALADGTRAALANEPVAMAAVKAKTQSPASFLKLSVPATVSLLRGAPCFTTAAWSSFGHWLAARKLTKGLVPAAAAMTTAYLPSSCRRR